MAFYVNSRTRVKAMAGISEEFNIEVGSVLSTLLFIIVMDELTKEIRKGVTWELMFADDLAFTEESEMEEMEMSEEWKAAMESKGLKVNIDKTKLMVQSGR